MQEEDPLEPRRIPNQKRAKATYDALIEATARVLIADGYEATSTNRIAEVAGVSVGSLYQYFPGKEALVMAVVKRHSQSMLDAFTETISEVHDMPIGQSIEVVIKSMVHAHSVQPALQRIVTEQVLHQGPNHITRMLRTGRVFVAAWLEQHGAEVLPNNYDTAAHVLLTAVEGAVHGAYMEFAGPVDQDELVIELVALVQRYLGVTDGKKAVRQQIRAARKALGPQKRQAMSQRIAAHVLSHPAWANAKTIAAYVGTRSEVETDLLLQAAGDRLVLPRVDAKGSPMSFCRVRPFALVPGAHGIPAPHPDAPAIDLGEIDLVLVPAVAIDSAGNRLGQGGGYYDRTLVGMGNAFKLGVIFGVQRVDTLEVGPHDQPMHAVVTEAGWETLD